VFEFTGSFILTNVEIERRRSLGFPRKQAVLLGVTLAGGAS
jgi:hypothetical protein